MPTDRPTFTSAISIAGRSNHGRAGASDFHPGPIDHDVHSNASTCGNPNCLRSTDAVTCASHDDHASQCATSRRPLLPAPAQPPACDACSGTGQDLHRLGDRPSGGRCNATRAVQIRAATAETHDATADFALTCVRAHQCRHECTLRSRTITPPHAVGARRRPRNLASARLLTTSATHRRADPPGEVGARCASARSGD
jgi:hypothetical protein